MEKDIVNNKKGNGLLIILLLIAICGIGFGLFEMLQTSKKDNEIADLKKIISNSSKNTQESKTLSGGAYIENNYFYVPEWGYKFKIPEKITSVGFSVDYDEAHVGYDLPFIGFTGVLKSDIQKNAQVQYYDNIMSCSIISVNRTQKNENSPTLTEYDRELDGYVIRISDYTSNNCNFNLHKTEVFNELKEMFQNPEKIN